MTAALLALALSAVSTSKIGVVVFGDDATSQQILAACPAMIVVPLAPGRSFGSTLLQTYRSNCTGGTIVAGMDVAALSVDPLGPAVQANTFWDTIGLPLVNALPVRPDWVEGPTIAGYASTADLAAFWDQLATRVAGAGFQPIVGRLDATVPAGDFCPTATALSGNVSTWGWSWRARTPTFTQDPVTESATTLGFRTVSSTCGLQTRPLFLTEAGPTSAAWPAGDASWLAWLDGEVRTEVQTAAAFEAGGTAPPTLAPVAAALAAHLLNPQPLDGGTPDGGPDGGPISSTGGGTPGLPDGPPGPGPKSTCSTSGAGFGLLALVPVLAVIRRRGRRGRSR